MAEVTDGRGNAPPAPDDFEVVDLSQPISAEMAAWRGTDRIEVSQEHLEIAHSVPGGEISATYLRGAAHAGTHVDAARHFFPQGNGIDDYPIDRFVCRGVAIDIPLEGPTELTREELARVDPGIRPGDAVLLHFGYAERYTEEAYYDHPYLGLGAAEYLAEREINIFGADLITPDMPAHRRETPFPFPVHSMLLGRDILIVENMGPGLTKVVGRSFLFVMGPFSIPGADASPVVPVALLSTPDP